MPRSAIDGAPALQRLEDELRELEAQSGIAADAKRLRSLMDAEPRDRRFREELRELYFGIADVSYRRRLIAKHREMSRLEDALNDAELADATRHSLDIERRSREGWWLAAIVGAALIVAGYELFATAGALAAAVVALFIGNGIEQESRRRQQRAIADARSALDSARVRTHGGEQLFSELEERTGTAEASQERVS